MMSTAPNQRVELGSIEVLPGGDGFVVGLIGPDSEVLRMEMPAWTVHQLMRWLPRIDAALQSAEPHQPSGQQSPSVIAYPVLQWSVRSVPKGRSVALSMLSDRRVQSAFVLGPDEARAIHVALGEAIAATSSPDVSARSDRATA